MDNLNSAYSWYESINQNPNKLIQLKKLIEKIQNDFKFDKIISIETGASHRMDDGCVGLFLAKLCELTNGESYSIDNNKDIIDKSKKLYLDYNLKTNHHLQDSIEFLENTPIIPNLIHLDSWDLDLKNPFPSALHGWREFIAIEDKMPIGSIIIIDDNFFKGTWVSWNYSDERESEKIWIDYPIVGKGSMVYHFIENGKSNWEKLSVDEKGSSIKLVYKKIK
tara:strand:+ start:159 stop:824 length:666 start_codon:yes stop_codon:yes gene_type:complete